MADDEKKPSRLDNGFSLVARDFGRAERLARFDPLQAFLVGEARELSWDPGVRDGTRAPKQFRFNLSALARVLECSRSWLTCQCAELVALGVLIEADAGDYLINKDYRDWLRRERTRDGERLAKRFTDAQLSWIMGVIPRRKGVRRTEQGGVCGPPNTSVQPERWTEQVGAVDRTGRSGGPNSGQMTPLEPPHRNARPETLETYETRAREIAPPPSSTAPVLPAPASVDADAGWDALASRLFPDDHDLGFALGAFASRYAPEWVEAAAWCAFANGVGRPRPYINACLSRWKARGGIPTDEAAAAESARSASAGPRDKGARIDDALARIMARQEAQP